MNWIELNAFRRGCFRLSGIRSVPHCQLDVNVYNLLSLLYTRVIVCVVDSTESLSPEGRSSNRDRPNRKRSGPGLRGEEIWGPKQRALRPYRKSEVAFYSFVYWDGEMGREKWEGEVMGESECERVRRWRTAFLSLRDEVTTSPPPTTLPQLLHQLLFSISQSLVSAAPDLAAQEVNRQKSMFILRFLNIWGFVSEINCFQVTSDLLFVMEVVSESENVTPAFSHLSRFVIFLTPFSSLIWVWK